MINILKLYMTQVTRVICAKSVEELTMQLFQMTLYVNRNQTYLHTHAYL